MTVALMVMSKPILVVWLGPRYEAGATALTILVAYWLTASSTAVAAPMLIAALARQSHSWYMAEWWRR